MKISTRLSTSALLAVLSADAVFGAAVRPTLDELADMLLARRHESRPSTKRDAPYDPKKDGIRSPNWSGAVSIDPAVDYQTVSAELVIPNVTFVNGFDPTAFYESSVWTGLSGFSDLCTGVNDCGTFNTGYYYLYRPGGDAGVYAFHEWWPGEAKWYKLNITAGDHIRMTVTHNAATQPGTKATGKVFFENLTTKQSESVDYTQPDGGSLDTHQADWIVQCFSGLDNSILYPDFGTLEWTNRALTAVDGKPATLENTYPVDADPKLNKASYMTKCSVDNKGATSSCKWNGIEKVINN